jgi:acyl-CoA reductase-like NAD-dependent aldehyde dehydrogenase
MRQFSVVSPVDGEVYIERPYAAHADIDAALDRAEAIAPQWRNWSVERRAELVNRAVDAFIARKQEISEELTWQMGRPIRFGPGEVGGFEERARYMASIAADALAPVTPAQKSGFNRFIRREPIGQVFVIAPWNYPYLTAVNAVVPALLAGNTVISSTPRRRRCAPSASCRPLPKPGCRMACSSTCISITPIPSA